jgi:CRISPR-associated protein Cmr1
MTWTTLTMRVTTPLFNGGADAGAAAPDLDGVRVASIRGAMRFWFRALAGALTGPDLRLLGALERRVFGGIGDEAAGGASASPLLLRIPDPPQATRAFSFPQGQDGTWLGYLLGLGLMRPDRGGPQLLRPCVPPDTTFELKVGFRHDRRASVQERDAVEALAFASLWLACTYGGFGARTRRGFGGLRITQAPAELPGTWPRGWVRTLGLDFYRHARWPWPWPPAVFGALERHLPALIAAENGTVRPLDGWDEPPPYPVLSREYSPAALAPRTFGSWQEALAYGGRQLRLFRANRPADEADRRRARVRTAEWDDVVNGDHAEFPLGALVLPVGYQDKLTKRKFTVNAARPGNPDPEELRRASPLWLRPVGSGRSWGLLTFAFQARFLPEPDDARVYLLPDRQAALAGWHRDELDVDQEDVTSLTSQWLAAIRGGGDFTTVIRD